MRLDKRPIARTLSRTYLLRTMLQMLAALGVVLSLAEFIFLAEKFTSILEEALLRHGVLSDILLLLVYTVPEFLDLALPIALLIAVYQVHLRLRESRELLVLSGSGVGPHQLMYLLIAIGIIGQIATFFVSGFVEPQARFAQRLLFYRAESHVLVSGLVAGQLYFFRDTVVYSTATRAGSRPVFIHRWLPDVNRVITAERTRIEESDDQSRLTLYLQNFTSNDFLRVAHQASADRGGTTDATAGYDSVFKRRVQGALVSEPILTDSLQSFQPRGTSLSEWTLPELVGLVPGPAATNKDHLAEAGRRIARALLCLIAPLLAYSAISFTTQRTNFLVLPVACALLVCIDLSMSAFAKHLALAGLPLLLAGLIVIAGSIAAALAVVSITRQNALVTPGLTNS